MAQVAGTPGREVARMRRDARLSQAKLAALVGTTQSAIARLEAGRVSPSIRTLQKVYAALGRELRLLAMPAAPQYVLSNARPEFRVAEAPPISRYDAHREADIDLSQIRESRRHSVPERLRRIGAADRGLRDFLREIGR
ncbi:MAG: helix-turn-helix domain-containing protein [Candidatus Dormiibacterota bacterium]